MTEKYDNYVGWLRFTGDDSHRRLSVCDSDSAGAFKVYRESELPAEVAAHAETKRVRDIVLGKHQRELADERAARAKVEAHLTDAREALGTFVDWHGGAHSVDCPKDDTCDCAGKPINDAVNKVLRTEPRP